LWFIHLKIFEKRLSKVSFCFLDILFDRKKLDDHSSSSSIQAVFNGPAVRTIFDISRAEVLISWDEAASVGCHPDLEIISL
jgi:hypothetical protein